MTSTRYLCALALLGVAPIASAQPRPAAELPVSRIVMFSSGVGYFQREGKVTGDAKIDLKFQTEDINDLLKSLVLQDLNGGKISTVNYDNRDPIDKTLKSFAIDLTDNPTLGVLLHQVRGERVALTGKDDKGVEFKVEGTVVSVQRNAKPGAKDETNYIEQLNLLTEQGLESHLLPNIQRIRFLKPELETEFHKALQVLAAGNDKQKKSVTFNFLGNGPRLVRVGYVTEAPIWKTSYRLSLDREGNKDKAFLQGWAIVENTTDEDWNNVRLGLVSGRPISFQMDLYEPLFLERPEVQLKLFSSIRPPLHGRSGVPAINPAGGAGDREEPNNPGRRYMIPSGGLGFAGVPGGGLGVGGGGLGGIGQAPMKDRDIDFRSSVVSAAMAAELGESFKYEIEQPVNLARQKSSLLPILQGPVEASKISIYNESVLARLPLLSLRLKNTTGLHLMQGPITVYESGVYAGDARATDLQPNETRLISYAIDQGMEVVAESPKPAEDIVSVTIVKGMMHVTRKTRFTRRYSIKNRSEHSRTVLVEHPVRTGITLVAPEKTTERSADFYRFEVHLKPGEQETLDVLEDRKRGEEIALTNLADGTIRIYLKQIAASPKVKEALESALKLKGELEATQKEIADENNALRVIGQDQSRMRANMERVPQTSEAYKRYLKKFDDQETEIEKRRAAITSLQTVADRQTKAYEGYLTGLNVE